MRGEIERLIDRFELRGRVRITGYLSNEDVLQELLAAGIGPAQLCRGSARGVL